MRQAPFQGLRSPGNKTPGKPCPRGVSALAGETGRKCSKVNAQILKGRGAFEGDKCLWGPRSWRGGSSWQYYVGESALKREVRTYGETWQGLASRGSSSAES